MERNSQRPNLLVNAILSMSSGSTGIDQNASVRLMDEKCDALPKTDKISSIHGSE